MSPHFFRQGDIRCHVPPLFLYWFCNWRGSKKTVMFVTSCVKLNVRSHTAKLMLKLETMGVGRGGGRGGALPFWILKLLAKKVVFSISRGKNQISPCVPPPLEKILGKSPTGPPWKKSFRRPWLKHSLTWYY